MRAPPPRLVAPAGPPRYRSGEPMQRPDGCWNSHPHRRPGADELAAGAAAGVGADVATDRTAGDDAQRGSRGQYAEVELPASCKAGDAIAVCTRDGRQLTVNVPVGVAPGESFVVLIPADLC